MLNAKLSYYRTGLVMKKTYITNMPTDIGSFLKANRCLTALGLNITRASYNNAIDSHTLFLDVEGTEEQIAQADVELAKFGYLDNFRKDNRIVLLQFQLPNRPGSAIDVLQLIEDFGLSISYINAKDTQTEHQTLCLGLYMNDGGKMSDFLGAVEKLCHVSVVDYDYTERYFDNSIFYNSFITGITRIIPLTTEQKDRLLVNTNLAMQRLAELGRFPHSTFDSIGRFAELLAQYKGDAFVPRISRHKISGETEIVLIEPPCGSNTTIIKSQGRVLFVDTGHACYQEEMLKLLRRELPGFDSMEKIALITHSDLDHCGLLPMFEKVLLSRKSADNLIAEYEGRKSIREHIPLHEPYINICKLLTGFAPPCPDKLQVLWGDDRPMSAPMTQVGFFNFGELRFEVYEGQGGHVPGETVLIDYAHHIAFTGDIYINVNGQTPQQATFNRYAPILMTSVDTDPTLCGKERQAVLQRLGIGKWQIFSGHGYVKEYEVSGK